MVNILTVIPARGGSKGVPGKNLKLLAGKPLVAHAIGAALASKHPVRVVCSTDSDEIAQVAKDFGAEVPFMRPAALAGDVTAAIAPVQHAVRHYGEAGWPVDIAVALHPTSPLLSAETIDAAVSRLMDEAGLDSVVGVRRIEHNHPFRAYAVDADGMVSPLTEYTSEKYLQKQDRPDAYGFVGGLYVRRRRLLDDWEGVGFALGERVGAVVVPREEAIDIDSELDLVIAGVVIDHFFGE